MITTTPPAIFQYAPGEDTPCRVFPLPRNRPYACTPELVRAQDACLEADAAHRLVYLSFPGHRLLSRGQALMRCVEAELDTPEEAKP